IGHSWLLTHRMSPDHEDCYHPREKDPGLLRPEMAGARSGREAESSRGGGAVRRGSTVAPPCGTPLKYRKERRLSDRPGFQPRVCLRRPWAGLCNACGVVICFRQGLLEQTLMDSARLTRQV